VLIVTDRINRNTPINASACVVICGQIRGMIRPILHDEVGIDWEAVFGTQVHNRVMCL